MLHSRDGGGVGGEGAAAGASVWSKAAYGMRMRKAVVVVMKAAARRGIMLDGAASKTIFVQAQQTTMRSSRWADRRFSDSASICEQ